MESGQVAPKGGSGWSAFKDLWGECTPPGQQGHTLIWGFSMTAIGGPGPRKGPAG